METHRAIFEADGDLALVRDSAARFAREHLADNIRAREAASEIPATLQRIYDDLGLALADAPDILGGLQMGALARVLITEELSAADAGGALALDRYGLAARAVALAAGPKTAERWITPILQDPVKRALVVVPGERWDSASTTLEIPWLPSGRVDLLILVGDKEVAAFDAGIEVQPVRGGGLRAAGASRVSLRQCAPAALWRDETGAKRARALTRLSAAAGIVGALRQGFEIALSFVREREAFGKPIAQHQAVSFLLADLQMTIEVARLQTQSAALAFEQGEWAPAASAFVACVEASRFVAPNCVQLLGGSGFMQDYFVEKVMRETRALGLLGGGVDAAREEALTAQLAPLPRERVA